MNAKKLLRLVHEKGGGGASGSSMNCGFNGDRPGYRVEEDDSMKLQGRMGEHIIMLLEISEGAERSFKTTDVRG